jgi:hypothetical protein
MSARLIEYNFWIGSMSLLHVTYSFEMRYPFMSKINDGIFDNIEIVQFLGFTSFEVMKPSTTKHNSYVNPFKFQIHNFVSKLDSTEW